MQKTPTHIAIIMDGNGRWAKKNRLPRYKGHEKGIEGVQTIIDACLDFSVPYLTLFAFSMENWKRPKDEVERLMKFLSSYLDDKRAMLHEKNIRFNVIGVTDLLPKEIQEKIKRNVNESKRYSRLTLTLALSYSGKSEIVHTVRRICAAVNNKDMDISDITEEKFSEFLFTRGVPDPDLLIRTSGEQRISNFFLWQISYAELYFTDKHWPEFGKDDLREAINEFNKRQRRFGKVM